MKHHVAHSLFTVLLIGLTTGSAETIAANKIMAVSAQSITIGKKHPATLRISSATVVNLNGRNTSARSLKTGMKAVVAYGTDASAASIMSTESAFHDAELESARLNK